ncbi:MAG: hypothetical protein WC343_04345, partial [Bacilli bacterium]
ILCKIIKGYEITLSFPYDSLKDINLITNKVNIKSKEFNELIKYVIMVNEEEIDIVEKLKLANATIINIKKDYYLNE